jgi:cytochrome c peroxidase
LSHFHPKNLAHIRVYPSKLFTALARTGAFSALMIGISGGGTASSTPPAAIKSATQNTSQAALGKTLFFSPAFSANNDIACATCHDPKHAYADARAVARGRNDQLGQRNTPSLLTSTNYERWSWDGRNTSLEAQVLEPLFSANEHAFTNERQALTTIRDTPEFATAYISAFGVEAPYTMDNIARALAMYVRSLAHSASTSTPSANAEMGRALFDGKASCATCHQSARNFTDNRFHLRYQGALAGSEASDSAANRLRLKTNSNKYQRNSQDATIANLGAFVAHLDPKDIGKFRTPSLHHVARTAPYMHDGSIATLRESVEAELKIRAPNATLSATEIDALVAYLESL